MSCAEAMSRSSASVFPKSISFIPDDKDVVALHVIARNVSDEAIQKINAATPDCFAPAELAMTRYINPAHNSMCVQPIFARADLDYQVDGEAGGTLHGVDHQSRDHLLLGTHGVDHHFVVYLKYHFRPQST